jgi:hypothetical protein
LWKRWSLWVYGAKRYCMDSVRDLFAYIVRGPEDIGGNHIVAPFHVLYNSLSRQHIGGARAIQIAQFILNSSKVHRESTTSRLSVVTSYLPKKLCTSIAIRVIYLCTRRACCPEVERLMSDDASLTNGRKRLATHQRRFESCINSVLYCFDMPVCWSGRIKLCL